MKQVTVITGGAGGMGFAARNSTKNKPIFLQYKTP